MTGANEFQVRRAETIVGNLLDDADERALVQELSGGLVISDLENDLHEFRAELALLDDIGAPFPALRVDDGDLVPMSVAAALGSARDYSSASWWSFRFAAPWDLRESLTELQFRTSYEEIGTREARRTVFARARDFLAARIAASEDSTWLKSPLRLARRRGEQPVTTPGCTFTVTTNSPGLWVFWSGAYFIAANYFGHPTTPTIGVLQAGRYVFGVDGGAYGSAVQWDGNALVTLPGAPQVHLNY